MKRCFIFLLSILFATSVFAADVNEVTLTVSGTADSEQEATLVALRSAIEQSFGTFVSANTTLLNDEIIKDEIVSVSAGNVKEYEKLGSYVLPNGKISVSLKATVAIQKLINYAKSKGSEAEFSGQTFAMNLKLMELREQNAISAIENMFAQIESMAMEAFDYEIEIGDPRIGSFYPIPVDHSNGSWFPDLGYRTFQQKKDTLYRIELNVKVKANTVTSSIYQLIDNTLNSLKLSKSDESNYRNALGSLVSFGDFSDVSRPARLFSFVHYNFLPIRDKYVQKLNSLEDNFYRSLNKSCFNYELVDLANSNHIVSWTHNPQSDRLYTAYKDDDHNSSLSESKCMEDNRGYIFAVVTGDGFSVFHRLGFSPNEEEKHFFLTPSKRWNLDNNLGDEKTNRILSHRTSIPKDVLHVFRMTYPIDRESLLKFGGFKLIKK